MDLKFAKSEKLIQHIQLCSHLINAPQDITSVKIKVLKLLYDYFWHVDTENRPNKDWKKWLKDNPIPTIEEIEAELEEKCGRVEEYSFWVKKLFCAWQGKLYPVKSLAFLYDGAMNEDVKYLHAQMSHINHSIINLFNKLSAESGVPVPDLYQKDDITEIIESLNEKNKESKENANEMKTGKPQQYEYDSSKIVAIYKFCTETNVLNGSAISFENFINAVNSADFKAIYNNAEQQNSASKCRYIIFILSKIIPGGDWYLNVAHSINTEPNRCSGVSVPSHWKKRANELK
jgi:hypothetical protein